MTSLSSSIVCCILGALVSLSAFGCNVARISLNNVLTPEDVAFIVPGKTTLADVVTKLGAPDSINDSDRGIVATYRFLDLKYSRVNFGWLVKPWTPVDPDLIFSRAGLGVDAFEVLCDPQWVVVHHGFQRHLPMKVCAAVSFLLLSYYDVSFRSLLSPNPSNACGEEGKKHAQSA